ncbi:MAG: glycosyltransferase family 4 protein [Cyanobacteria bacterium J06607_10]
MPIDMHTSVGMSIGESVDCGFIANEHILLMNITVLENQPSSRRGGQELSLFDVCRGLAKKGHSITLLYTATGNLLDQYATFCSDLIKVDNYRFNAKRPLQSLSTLLPDLWTTALKKADVVYSNQYHDSFFGCTLSRLKQIPFVCHLRLPPPSPLGWQWKIGMKGASRLIAVSNHTKQEWCQLGYSADAIDVVYNGINETIFSPASSVAAARQQLGLPADRYVVSYVGRLDRHKGIETLIQGFAQLNQPQANQPHANQPQANQPQACLAIAGKPHNDNASYLAELQSLAAHLNVAEKVVFLGHVDRPVQVYQSSDLVVLPSEWPEPFGRTIIEAMSSGVPVLASRVGGIPEILTDSFSHGLFESANPHSIAEKLHQHLPWREQNPTLGRQCREHVLDKFTLDAALANVERSLLKAVQH